MDDPVGHAIKEALLRMQERPHPCSGPTKCGQPDCSVCGSREAALAAGIGWPPDEAAWYNQDPCDCGTVRGKRGLYLDHVPGGHPDCTHDA